MLGTCVGFPGSSAGKESARNAGDPSSIPGSGRSPGEGIGYPLKYSWASLVAQMVKNPLEMWETWIQSLGWEDAALEEDMANHSVFLPGEFHGQRSLAGCSPWGHKELDMTKQLSTQGCVVKTKWLNFHMTKSLEKLAQHANERTSTMWYLDLLELGHASLVGAKPAAFETNTEMQSPLCSNLGGSLKPIPL